MVYRCKITLINHDEWVDEDEGLDNGVMSVPDDFGSDLGGVGEADSEDFGVSWAGGPPPA